MSRSSISDNLKSVSVFRVDVFPEYYWRQFTCPACRTTWIESYGCRESMNIVWRIRLLSVLVWGQALLGDELHHDPTAPVWHLSSCSTQEVLQGPVPGTRVPVQGWGCHAVPKLWEWEATTNCVSHSQCTTRRRSAKSNLIDSFSPLLIGFVSIDHLPVVCQSETVFFK